MSHIKQIQKTSPRHKGKNKLHTWNDVRIPVFTLIFFLVPNMLCPPAPIRRKSLKERNRKETPFKMQSLVQFIIGA